ncbi:MAG TPA: carboxypeptidase regulatory-like domain-containing protein [Terriglobales bacterium]|jgi:hypothetical protein|nr:carboxypeptidase regulatory-like domain-containing protein [Terriglobales bacterium]
MSRSSLFLVFLASAMLAQTAKPTEPSARIPVKKIVLYKNGVGYFEHSARVHGNQELNIDFTTAQLNDALKSLTAVDLGEGRISSVRYNSVAPLEERLKALRLPFGINISQAEFLAAARGSRVEAHSGSASASGRLLSVETEQVTSDKGTSRPVTKFSLMGDNGEVRNFELGPGTSVRLAERELSDEVGKYLNLLSSSRARDLRRMTISATGTGDRDVFVSYISEVPIWKSTYRIILPSKPSDKPLLQGWAIVDNTVGEDWKDVRLSLVAGSPQSFIQEISQPYYARRPVVDLPQSVMLTPQAHEGTLKSLPLSNLNMDSVARLAPGVAGSVGSGGLYGIVSDMSGGTVPGAQVTVRNEETGVSQSTTSDANGKYQFFNVPAGNSALFVNSSGFQRFDLTGFYLGVGRMNEIDARLTVGSVSESITVQAAPAVLNSESAELSQVARNQHIEADGKEQGDYFAYDIKQPVSIGKNQSALVPVLQAHVDIEKVSLWNEESKEIRRALWLKNSSDYTLDSGTFNILESDTFGGEGVLETVHPDERRLLSYAADPALRIVMDQESHEQPYNHVSILKGVMILTREDRDSRKYTLHNSDTTPRQVVIEHPAREGWKLAEGGKPEETTPSFLRFRVAVAPGQTEELKIEEFHPEASQYQLSDLDDDQVELISQEPLTPAVHDALKRVIDQKQKIDDLDDQVNSRTQEITAVEKDQTRVRENMKALKGSAEERALVQRYTRQLDQQEDRLNVLNKEITDLRARKSSKESELQKMIQAIVMDESF